MGDEIARFIDAAWVGNLQEVENLLRKGVNPSARNMFGNSGI